MRPYLNRLRALASAVGLAFTGPAMAGLLVDVPPGGNVPAAVAEVGAAGGGTVRLAKGVHHLAAPIVISSNTTITGQGADTILLAPPSPHSWPMIENAAEGLTSLTFENFVLDGNIPLGAYLVTPSGKNNPYQGMGIYIFGYTTPTKNVVMRGLEIRNTAEGFLFGTVTGVTAENLYVHDNNPGSFAHNAYFVNCNNVTVSHSRFVNAHGGDGLHINFGGANYLITKSEFSGNPGIGVLDQAASGVTIQDSIADLNGENGFESFSDGSLTRRDAADDSQGPTSANGGYAGYGYLHLGGSGAYTGLAGIGNVAGFGYVLGIGGYGTTLTRTLTATIPNRYLAVLAQGALGPVDTADWTMVHSGFSAIGAVDFNARHLGDGALTFPAVGVVTAGTYSIKIRYANGAATALSMPLLVNGASVGSLNFPPTGGWSTWSTITVPIELTAGANALTVTPDSGGAPLLDYLQVETAVPATPGAPCTVALQVASPYAVGLSWVAVPGAATYAIARSIGSGSPVTIATGLTGTAFVDDQIRPGGSTVTYSITAANQGGSGPACGTPPTTTTPVDAPAGLRAAFGATGITLHWMSANGATAYNVKRAPEGSTAFTTIASVPNTTNVTSTHFEEAYIDTTAPAGQGFSYMVSALSTGAESADSYSVTVLK